MPKGGSHDESAPSVTLISHTVLLSVSTQIMRQNLTTNYNHFLTNS
jgi:hypothetical protein